MLKWTSDLPIKPGFYYWQGGSLQGDEVAIVQVRPPEADELLLSHGSVRPPKHGPVSQFGGIWAGPLPQPYRRSSDLLVWSRDKVDEALVKAWDEVLAKAWREHVPGAR